MLSAMLRFFVLYSPRHCETPQDRRICSLPDVLEAFAARGADCARGARVIHNCIIALASPISASMRSTRWIWDQYSAQSDSFQAQAWRYSSTVKMAFMHSRSRIMTIFKHRRGSQTLTVLQFSRSAPVRSGAAASVQAAPVPTSSQLEVYKVAAPVTNLSQKLWKARIALALIPDSSDSSSSGRRGCEDSKDL